MTALIELETEDFAQASRSLHSDVADPLTGTVQRLVTCLQGCAAMAGNDPAGRDWAASYDRATASTLAATQDAVNACFRLSALFAQTARNYELADAASTAGVRQAIAAATTRLPSDYWFCVATRMPSAAGGSGGGPPGWGLIAGLVGFLWPDGHQDRLRTAAQAWRSCADSVWAHSDYVAFAAVPAIVDHLPESNDMSSVCTAMYSHLRDVAHAQYALADACDELAHHLDEVHSAVEGELAGLVEWTAGIEFAGTLLSVVTLGAAEAPTQAVEGARIARTAARVAELIDKFVALARASAESIAAVMERAGAASARLRAILDMKVTEATVALVGRIRTIRADGELEALGRLGDAGRSEAATFADRAAARAGLSGDLRPACNRFFKGATAKSRNFKITKLPDGHYRMEFFSPANNVGFGKRYVGVIDTDGRLVARFKDTVGPRGLVERKWMEGGPDDHGY